MVLSVDGSTRSWLKYIGLPLELLTCVHDPLLSSERKISPVFESSAGGIHPAGGCGAAPAPPPPRPATYPRVGPPLLHQSNDGPPRPPPSGCSAVADSPACPPVPALPALPARPSRPARPVPPAPPAPTVSPAAPAPGGVASVSPPVAVV